MNMYLLGKKHPKTKKRSYANDDPGRGLGGVTDASNRASMAH